MKVQNYGYSNLPASKVANTKAKSNVTFSGEDIHQKVDRLDKENKVLKEKIEQIDRDIKTNIEKKVDETLTKKTYGLQDTFKKNIQGSANKLREAADELNTKTIQLNSASEKMENFAKNFDIRTMSLYKKVDEKEKEISTHIKDFDAQLDAKMDKADVMLESKVTRAGNEIDRVVSNGKNQIDSGVSRGKSELEDKTIKCKDEIEYRIIQLRDYYHISKY